MTWYLRCYGSCSGKNKAVYRSRNLKFLQTCEECKPLWARERGEINWSPITRSQHFRAQLSWPLEALGRWLWNRGFRFHCQSTDWLGLWAYRIRGDNGG
jgi:hypothetical protein